MIQSIASPMLKSVLSSTVLGCLLLGTGLLGTGLLGPGHLPTHATPAQFAPMPPSPIIDSNFRSNHPRAIAQAVLKDAIATEKLDKTAKTAQIQRVGRGDGWMFAPVPYWKITIADRRQTLVYLTTQEGSFRALVLRNGQPTQPTGQPATEVAPPDMSRAALNQAVAIWGYTINNQTKVIAEENVSWTSGCEAAPFNPACSPMVFNGWKITVAFQDAQLVFRGRTAQDLQLIERTSTLERRLPAQVLNQIRQIAGKHFQLSPAVVSIDNVDLQTYSDSCLGLGDLTEACALQMVKGYRVSVSGKTTQRQIYRISNDTNTWRAEAIAGLPTRTDELPTAIALKVFKMAQSDLKQPIANLKILNAEPTYRARAISGWKVLVTNNQQFITYTLELNGKLLSKR
jgi:hypothetical protein